MFCKKVVLQKFANVIRKHLCWSLFLIKLQAFQICNFIKKILQHRCFPVISAKFFKNSYFEEHLRTNAFSYVCQVIENTAIGTIYFVNLLQTCLLEPSLLQKLKLIKVVIKYWFSVFFWANLFLFIKVNY